MAAADEWVGKTLGNYTLQSVIGKGGMGMVFAGEHRFLKDKVAVKVLHGNFVQNESVARRFFQEATSTRAIDHPNIIKIFDFGQSEPDGDLYLVMELLEGETLARILKGGQRLDESLAARIGAEIADGLAAAHDQGVIHRDLKPDNIFVNQVTGHVKVIDFGVAKLQGSASSTRAGAVLGTPEFMAPEQAKTASKVGPATDIYALGVILFRACTGRLPFQAEEMLEMISAHIFDTPPKPSAIVPISSEMETLILHCMEKDPAQRPPSMGDVRDRLLARAASGQWDEHTRQVRAVPRLSEADHLVSLDDDDVGPPEVTTQTPPPLAPDEVMDAPRSTGGPTKSERKASSTPGNEPKSSSEPGTPSSSAGEVVRLPSHGRASGNRAWLAVAAVLVLVGTTAGLVVLRKGGTKVAIPTGAAVQGVSSQRVEEPVPGDVAAPNTGTPAPSTTPLPAAPADGPVEVVVKSVPAGAQVRIDGEVKGTTPAALRLQLPQDVELSLPGYKTTHYQLIRAGVEQIRLAPIPRPQAATKPAGKPTFLAPSFLKQPDNAAKKPREGLD